MAPVVFASPVRNALLGDDEFSPCYLDFQSKAIYRWNGVVLRRAQVPDAGESPRSPVLTAKDFTVVPVEAPVKYREIDGGYGPGYLDRDRQVFYEWKGVVLHEQELLNKGKKRGQRTFFGIHIIPEKAIENYQ